MAQAALNLFLFVVGPCAASLSDGLPEITVASGLAAQLQMIFPSEHGLAVDRAVADGLAQALADEAMDINEVSCNRDYSQQCPSGWADMGDTTTCTAPLDYQGSCQPMLKWGGLTAQQKRQQASQCGAEFPCVGQCAPDFVQPCPHGWQADVNGDCLAPSSYSGRCVLRKSFVGMRLSEKKAWARTCGVAWPCRKPSQDARQMARMRNSGAFDLDCAADYSQACPKHHVLKGGLCIAREGFSGICGLALSSKYDAVEKAAYAEACLAPWPCVDL